MFPFDDFSPAKPHVLWLAAFAAALGLALVGAMCRLFRAGRVSRASWLVWSAASLLPAAICLADAFRRLDGALDGSLALVANGALVAIMAVACYWMARWQVTARYAVMASHATVDQVTPRAIAAPRVWRLSWCLLLGNALAAAWAATCFYHVVDPGDSWLPPEPVAHTAWVKVPSSQGRTDSGTAIDLLKAEDDRLNGVALASIFGDRFRERVIEVSSTDDRSNCHGWVFAGGQFAVGGPDVDTILAENQYDVAERPQPGDVIVYRDGGGKVVHTGLVRLAEGDLVIVESKWGAHARYLHRPLDQAYSTTYGFYRSSRRGHLISLGDDASDAPGEKSDHADLGTIVSLTPESPAPQRETVESNGPALSLGTNAMAAKKHSLKSPSLKNPNAWSKTNPLWWPKRPAMFSHRPFHWHGFGGPWPSPSHAHPSPLKRQGRG